MKKIYICLLSLFVFSVSSQGQFSGSFASSNWNIGISSGSNGTVDFSGTPASLIITGSDAGGGGQADTDLTILIPTAGIWSFQWDYMTFDGGAHYDPAYVLVGSDAFQLTDNMGSTIQNGTYTSGYLAAGTMIGFRVRATDDVGGAATLSISAFSAPAGILPVKLNSFTARNEGPDVLLRWKTDIEINASHFEAQRSADGINFSVLATIDAHSSDSYQAMDHSPFNGINYYRLRMVDNDGSFSYSPVVSVRTNHSGKIKLYPNPAYNQLNLAITVASNAKDEIRIYDAGGRVLKTQFLQLEPGINTITIDISTLATGSYFLKGNNTGAIGFTKH